jgi:EAL domain-containing protein (putative c-di-GMP-specific phosphodiesterase class I)
VAVLLRWNNPVMGMVVMPDRFIPLAEETGLIIAIDK